MPTMSCPSFRLGTIEYGPQKYASQSSARKARTKTRTMWPTKSTVMMTAEMRWISAAPWKPPIAFTSVTAQPWSANSSGTPVSARPMNEIIMNACITISTGPKRR